MLAAESLVVRAGAGRPENLGEQFVGLAAYTVECLAEHDLGPCPRVDVGGVESRDSFVQRRSYAGERLVLFDLVTMGDPVAV